MLYCNSNWQWLVVFYLDSYLGLILILAWMYSTSELDELFRILISIKGFKLRQPQWSNTTIELSMIVTELGLPHIIKNDNGASYNSKEFQQFLQCYSITHQTSSPNHPRSNGFVERMVGAAKKLMDKAEKEGKLDFRFVWLQGHTLVRQHCITFATNNTAHSKGKEFAPIAQ